MINSGQKNADDNSDADGKMRMIKCGWKYANRKMRMIKSRWKNADDKKQMQNADDKMRMIK